MTAEATDWSAMSTNSPSPIPIAPSPIPIARNRLLPAIHRMRDAEQGYPLQALLRVIGEQVEVVEDDVEQPTRTGSSRRPRRAVPYIADLIGFRPIAGTVDHAASWRDGGALERVLVPRRAARSRTRSATSGARARSRCSSCSRRPSRTGRRGRSSSSHSCAATRA